MNDRVSVWLRQGISPRRLALTLAIGFAVGCIPVIGVPTFLCALLAVALRLNLPAIQVANYAAMPFQLALIVPFVRLGGRLVSSGPRPAFGPVALMRLSPEVIMSQMTGMAGQALLAWLLLAIPTVALITLTLTPFLRRIPALAGSSEIAR
jgi:uncharacterized protein (DUF2062 family)